MKGLYNKFYGIFASVIPSTGSVEIQQITSNILATVCSLILVALPFVLLYKIVNMVIGA